MKFRCERDTLISALGKAGRAVTSRTGPVVGLTGLHLELTGDALAVTGSDLDITIAARVTVSGVEDGAVLVTARLISDVVRSLELGSVEVERGERTLTVSSGRSTFSLRTIPEGDFPKIPTLSEATVTVDGPALVSGLRQVVCAAGSDDARPVLTGVLVTTRGKGLRMVATDSYRLSQRDLPSVAMQVDEKGVLVPSRVLEEVARLVTGSERVGVQLDERTVLFEVDDVRLSARLINGDFPSYESLIPTDHPNSLVVNRQQLLDAIRRMRLVAADKTPLRVQMGKDGTTLSAVGADVGEASEEIEANYTGEDLLIAFRAEYFQDGVEVLDSEDVVLRTGHATKPALLQTPDDDDFLYLLMPVRVT